MYISLPTYEHQIRNGDEWQRIAVGLYQRTLAAVASAPGIQGVASVSHLPLAGFYYLADFEVEGFSTDRNDPPRAIDRAVSSTYHETIGVPLREGRYFNAFDRAGSLPVVLVNEQFAKRFFHGRSAVGGRLRYGRGDGGSPWRTIAGVVAGERAGGMEEEPKPMVYSSMSQNPWSGST